MKAMAVWFTEYIPSRPGITGLRYGTPDGAGGQMLLVFLDFGLYDR